jgi:phospholipase C
MRMRGFLSALALSTLAGCSVAVMWSSDAGHDAASDVPAGDTRANDGGDGARPDVVIPAPRSGSNIRHVVLIVQENHTFDTYFGSYCRAPSGSNPTCNDGPDCCEAVPATEPSGTAPVALDDQANGAFDPNHSMSCELAEINDGQMDRFVTGAPCSDHRNFAIAGDSVAGTYRRYAGMYALADRYFQPIVGQTSANDMYFAVARHVFTDNEVKPAAIGQGCIAPTTPTAQYTGRTTVADVLIDGGYDFAVYAEGYSAMRAAVACPAPPSDCRVPLLWPLSPCNYDPSDVPFEYYQQFTDNVRYMKDFTDFASDLSSGTLPSFSYIKLATFHNEHPGFGTFISDGVTIVDRVVQSVLASQYANDTLVLITWDEGGGYFDHVAPPPTSTIDMQPPGTRVPLLAIGRFARHNFVSHVVLEHSSIVSFLEFNFLGTSGQLGNRDTVVNNLGSLLDPAQTGVVIP